MYAIIESGGKQYKVRQGDTVDVELLRGEAGDTIELDQVLMVAGADGMTVGTPIVDGAVVRATVVDEVKGDKVVVFKYKPKNRYRRKTGHRQKYTRLQIEEIFVPGLEEEPEAEVAEVVEETLAAEEASVTGVPESTEAGAEIEAVDEPETTTETATEETDQSKAAEEAEHEEQ